MVAHRTIARFVERHQDALAGVFGEVLGLCAKAGLVGLNVVAIDGSKIAANASREANRDYERLAREVIEGVCLSLLCRAGRPYDGVDGARGWLG